MGKRKMGFGLGDDTDPDSFVREINARGGRGSSPDFLKERQQSVDKLKFTIDQIIEKYSTVDNDTDVVDLENGNLIIDRGELASLDKSFGFGSALTPFLGRVNTNAVPSKIRRTDEIKRLKFEATSNQNTLTNPIADAQHDDGDGTDDDGTATTFLRSPGGACDPVKGCSKAFCFRCASNFSHETEPEDEDDEANISEHMATTRN
eukprot:m.268462 g.268462  ORF g.268462 m.268462 type:complete len:205 (-) comp78568_c0_seq1:196-810(-)